MILFVISLSLLGAPEEPGQNRIDFFEKKIRPVLAERCYQCHSAEAAGTGMLMGKLQLDTREGVERGGARGPAVVPGRPDQSMLIDALNYTDPSCRCRRAANCPTRSSLTSSNGWPSARPIREMRRPLTRRRWISNQDAATGPSTRCVLSIRLRCRRQVRMRPRGGLAH